MLSIPLPPPPPPATPRSPPAEPLPLSPEDIPERRAWNRILSIRDTIMKKATVHAERYEKAKRQCDMFSSATTTLNGAASSLLLGTLMNPALGYVGFACCVGNFCLGRVEAAYDIRARATREHVILLQIEALVTELNAIIARSELSPIEMNTVSDNTLAKIQIIELTSGV